ncbi:PTS IIA-like nitrogen-regulatory protein PtsN [Sphingomonas metalli]|uniref:PTS IIA-like nitrogen-regulatory protein PtsN n=1 Tax=Sphingomonas metalli TaxID=1779358 RepID=A0A916TB27_9SPHN|nr:PTS sugar transporter subunit IIA [Sphingomonas metalli]GGB38665.1 PTS IIA-like nitrogen-regulatory protein PtsN [Sphingomonas metalli]
MTDFSDLLRPEAVLAGLAVASKKALFQQVAAIAATSAGLDPALVAERLGAREKLGSTGFGGGVAIPHAKLAGLEAPVGVFVRLAQPMAFQAVDDLPVDLVFALLSPERAGSVHLKALARVSRRMRDQAFLAKLRGAGSRDALYALFTTAETRHAA